MKNLRVATLLVLALFVFRPSAIRGETVADLGKYRLVVRVTSADRHEPIKGARVIAEWGYSSNRGERALRQTETTDEGGNAYIIYDFTGETWKPYHTFYITVNHPDFAVSNTSIPVTKDMPSGDIRIDAALSRQPDRKVVEVNLVSAGDRQPIYDARIALTGTGLNAIYDATTEMNGQAVINVTEADNYQVTISHVGFETIKTSLRVKGYDDEQKTYVLNLEMQRTKKSADSLPSRTVRVSVRSRNAQGEEVPVRYAEVSLPAPYSVSHITDREGNISFTQKFPLGELIKVDVEANHYKPGSDSFTVEARNGIDSLTIWLEPEGSGSKPEESGSGNDRFVGSWSCPADITIELRANGEGAWVDKRPLEVTKSAPGRFEGKWTASGDSVTLNVTKGPANRQGRVTFSLSAGKLHDPWGNVYTRE